MADTLTLEDIAKEVQRVGGNVQELTGYMTTLAKRVYSKNDPVETEHEPEPEASEKTQDWEKAFKSRRTVRFLKSTKKGRMILRQMEDIMGNDEEYGEEYPDMVGEDKGYAPKKRGGTHGRYARYQEGDEDYPPLDDMNGNMDIEDDGMMPYDNGEEYEDEDMMMAMKLLRAVKGYQPRKSRRTEKGFADRAKKRADEEDTPYGEKDDDVIGNEEQPAGRQGGDRQEETFGPGGMAYSAMLKQFNITPENGKLLAQILKNEGEGQEVAKALIPAGASGDSRGGKVGAGGEVITREMQEETKGRSYRDINRLRMDVGDLPRTLF